ncbi:PepSY domain-containing protein [Rhodopirellula sp. P2]|uniref:PepSY domain-containing protein n=1 Tax=Rhodopirellula sp. P2 TaxID=2127060 RepID=UPI002368441C|nr:PepSY domain-containing protein [Rhodopirellula sp. P2]WDQ14923.1 PepSY domain-containing protein [Rhodopirellula sp. P2]
MNSNDPPASKPIRRSRKARSKVLMFLRRVHLYVGLFLLPWVFLYGATGAMLNHVGLFPEAVMQQVDASELADSAWADLPDQNELAEQVVDAMRVAAPDSSIELNPDHPPEFTNEIGFQIEDAGIRHAVHLNPVDKSAWVATFPENREPMEPVLLEINRVDLIPNPVKVAEQTVPTVLSAVGIDSTEKLEPLGWSKLNFLANVDGEPVRVTYVLRDGHLDVTRYTGEDGFSPRAFFVRLHTSHGQPPHWNGRRFWSLFIDAMAIAMVTWGVTGLLMWWQIKRTRWIGGIVIAISVVTASAMFFSMMSFYATTKL